jgi:hypothetical protein
VDVCFGTGIAIAVGLLLWDMMSLCDLVFLVLGYYMEFEIAVLPAPASSSRFLRGAYYLLISYL